MGLPIATNSGAIITTGGNEILADVATTNDDTQLFDFSVNLMKALLWEYNEALNLQTILQLKQDWYETNQDDFWTNWIRDVFDMRTANEFGLSVWSIILDLPLFTSSKPDSITKPTFGFDNAYFKNFDRGNFSSKTGGTTSLPLETKRLALRLRYFGLTTSGTVPEINRFMNYLFANYGRVVLEDNQNMTQTYVFFFPVTSDLQTLFGDLDILPRPAGVGSAWRDATKKSFGFGNFGLNFNRGNFGA